MLSYITPEEGGILQLLGGSGAPGPMGIPSFFLGDDGDGEDDAQDYGDGSGDFDTGDTSQIDGDYGQDSFDYYAGSDNRPSSVLTDSDPIRSVEASRLIDSGTFNPSNSKYNTMDFGSGSVSNVSNMSNYDPNFAANIAVSRGLDPRAFKDFDKTPGQPGFDSRISMNPLAQIDPKSALGQRHLQALRAAPNVTGPFREGLLNNLTLAEIDKLDPADLSRLYASQDMSRTNTYGTKELPGIGITPMLVNLLYGGDPSKFSYDRSDTDSIQTGRSRLNYGAIPGNDINDFGKVDLIGKLSDGFTELSDAVKGMLGFAKDSRGGYTAADAQYDVAGSSLNPDQSVKGFSMRDNNNNINNFNMDDDNTPNEIIPKIVPAAVTPEQYVGQSFLPSNIDNLLNSNKAKQNNTQNNTQYNTASSSRKPIDFSTIDKGLESVRSGIANINRNKY